MIRIISLISINSQIHIVHYASHTILCLIVVGGYIAFFQIFHPQNHFTMTLPFYKNVRLGPTPTFYYKPPPY